jgi:hypothetical protein
MILKPVICLLLGVLSLAQVRVLDARPGQLTLQAVRLDCSTTRAEEITAAAAQTAAWLKKKCGVVLKLKGVCTLEARPEWCDLSFDPLKRMVQTDEIVQAAEKTCGRTPGTVFAFFLPSGQASLISWAYVDRSLKSGCGAPQEKRFLNRFGSLFITDFGWRAAAARDEDRPAGSIPFAALLTAHELIHALTHLAHPTKAPRGSVMADSLTDLGEELDPEICGCLRQSPYLH